MQMIDSIERWNERLSKVGAGTFFDAGLFPWIKQVKAIYPEIRAELANLDSRFDQIPTMAELSGKKDLIEPDSWRACFLYLYGRRLTEPKFLPQTHRALSLIPDMRTAFLSIMPPNCVIPPHRGPYNGVLRFHLGLSIPPGDCAITVGDETRTWTEGEGMVFDDSHTHTAWNRTDQPRVVLFVDFLRPLPFWYAPLNRAAYNRLCKGEFREAFLANAKRSAEKLSNVAREQRNFHRRHSSGALSVN